MRQKGFSFFRMAFRNVVRMPIRSLLYLAVLTVLAAATFLGIFLLRATDNALLYLYDNYDLYASLTPRVERDPSGNVVYNNIAFSDNDIKMIISSPLVENYSQTVYCGARVTHRGTLEDTLNSEANDDVRLYWNDERLLPVRPIRDIDISRSYVNGNMVIVDGRAFEGGNEIILPSDFCSKNGITVGDTVTVRLTGVDNTLDERCYGEFTVVGIFSGISESNSALAEISSEYYRKLVTEATGVPGGSTPGNRIDVKLKTPDSIDGFIQYLNDNGFDFMNYQVLFNDAAYNVARTEIENVKSIVRIVFYTVLFICIGLVAFLTVYFISNRSNEKTILHALGLKKCSVNAIFCLELVFVLIVAAVFGTVIGYGVSGVLVKAVEGGTVDNIVKIDESGSAEAENIVSYIGIIESKPEIKFLMSYTPAGGKGDVKKLYGEKAYTENGVYKTYDTMYDGEGNAYRIYGSEEVTTGQVIESGDVKSGVTIDCIVPERSGLKVGDIIELHLFPPKTVLCLEYPEKYYVSRFAVNFRVIGFGGEGDISVPFGNLVSLTRYVTGSYLR